MSQDNAASILVLHTGLFADAVTLTAAVDTLPSNTVEQVTLQPAHMNDSDWDELIRLVLSVPKVITV